MSYVLVVEDMVCIKDAVDRNEASYILSLLTANQVACLVEDYNRSGRTPDLDSNGLRKVLVQQADQGKANRLIDEMVEPQKAPDEYGEPPTSARRSLLGWLSDRLHHRQ